MSGGFEVEHMRSVERHTRLSGLRLVFGSALLCLAGCSHFDRGAASDRSAAGQPAELREEVSTGPRSLVYAVRAALADSPDIGIVDAQLDDARAAIDVAAAERGPFVDLTATTGPESVYNETFTSVGENRTEISLSLERTLYDFGAIEEGIAQRRSLASAAELVRLDTMEDVALETIFAYLDYLQNTELTVAAVRNTRNHQRIADLVAQNEQGGNATLADVNRALSRLEAARSSQLEAENAREDAIISFRRLTGLSPAEVQVPLILAPPSQSHAETAFGSAIVSNPELQSIRREIDAFQRLLARQRAGMLPRIFVRVQGNVREDVGGPTGLARDASALVGFNTRLYSAGARQAQMEQTRAQIRELEETYRATLRDLEEEAEQIDQSQASASENSVFVNERFVTARDGLALFQEQFEAGERTAFELLDAQRDFFLAETERIDNRFERASNVYRELRLRGMLVATVLASGP